MQVHIIVADGHSNEEVADNLTIYKLLHITVA